MTRFDDEFPGFLESEQDAPRARSINPFEIALWVLSLVLIIGGVAMALWANRVTSGGFSCDGGDCSPPPDYAWAQAAYIVVPSLFTAGLCAVVVSLALRALLVATAHRGIVAVAVDAETDESMSLASAQERTVGPMPSPPADETGAVRGIDSHASAQFRVRRRSVDHSAFQRPPSD
jgi:hypothetical protein